MPDVLIEKRHRVGFVTLNRPRAINALDHAMVRAIAAALHEWSDAPDVDAVVVTGSGERGLCAGGDIASIYRDARSGGTLTAQFWRDEYHLNAVIARYPKPYVAVMDGIVMGGGVGISAHGSHRIVTERSMVGMPEVGIGFVPDVGGTYLLARSPGELGTHVALTTARLRGADAIAIGLADHYVPTAIVPDLLAAIGSAPVGEAVAAHAQPAPESELLAQRQWIDECYCVDSVDEIVARLQSHGSAEAAKAAEQILGKSPIAVKVALRSLRRARQARSLEEVLNEEYRVSLACFRSHDMVEGIRAQVIDKDRDPHWSPATLGEVTSEQIDACFEPLGDLELGLTPPADSR